MEKTDQRCVNCKHCVPAIIDGKESSLRKSCDVPFDLAAAPAVIARHYIIEPGTNAPECPYWAEAVRACKWGAPHMVNGMIVRSLGCRPGETIVWNDQAACPFCGGNIEPV